MGSVLNCSIHSQLHIVGVIIPIHNNNKKKLDGFYSSVAGERVLADMHTWELLIWQWHWTMCVNVWRFSRSFPSVGFPFPHVWIARVSTFISCSVLLSNTQVCSKGKCGPPAGILAMKIWVLLPSHSLWRADVPEAFPSAPGRLLTSSEQGQRLYLVSCLLSYPSGKPGHSLTDMVAVNPDTLPLPILCN